MPYQCQRKQLLIIMVLLSFSTLFFLPGCFGKQNSQYLSYMDTGEGTFLLFKLELKNNKSDSYLYCLSDAVLELLNDNTTESFRGYNQPGEHLKSSDIKKYNQHLQKLKV